MAISGIESGSEKLNYASQEIVEAERQSGAR